jgi:hypothetical protein
MIWYNGLPNTSVGERKIKDGTSSWMERASDSRSPRDFTLLFGIGQSRETERVEVAK